MDTQHQQAMPTNSDTQILGTDATLLDETLNNLRSQRRVKNVLFLGLPSAGKSSLINSFATLIHGKHLPVASVGQGEQPTHTYASPRYNHFGLTEDHLKSSLNKETASTIHPYLPNLDDFTGLADENTPEIKEVLKLKVFGYLKPGIQVTGLFNIQTKKGVGSLRSVYTKSKEEWKTDVVIFVHNVAVKSVPKKLIACILDVIKPQHTISPVDLDLFIVLTNYDKVKSGEVSEKTLKSVENDIASSFGVHGSTEYKLFTVANWCDSVGFPSSFADNMCQSDETGGSINNQLLKLLRNMSIPKAEQEPIEELTHRQQVRLELYRLLRIIYGWVQVHLREHAIHVLILCCSCLVVFIYLLLNN